jgi:hypothetical protein
MRTLMVVVAGSAVLLLPVILLIRLSNGMEGFYGPHGFLARSADADKQHSAGEDALRRGMYAEAETRFQAALDLERSKGTRLERS